MSKNDLAIVLELEKESSLRENEMFYRYAIGDFKLWFSQTDDGNIYTVWFKENGDTLKDFELHIYADEDKRGGYYPNVFEIRPRSYPMTTADAWEFMTNMKRACRVLDAVEEFFASSKHYELYAKHYYSGEKSVKVEVFPDKGGSAIYSQVYPVQSQDEALKMFREEHPEYKGCILVAEYVFEKAPAVEEKEENELISRQALLSDIKLHLGNDWDAYDEDCKRAWNVIAGYSSPDVDLFPRGKLLDAVLDNFGCDLAYFGRDLQYIQEAIQFLPAASAGKVDDLIANATDKCEKMSKDSASKCDVDLGKA